jgi:hypothetical protein
MLFHNDATRQTLDRIMKIKRNERFSYGRAADGWPSADGSNPYRFKAKNITDENLCGG